MAIQTDAAGLDLTQFLRKGDRIVIGQACGEPTTLIETLIQQGRAIGGLSAFVATSFSGASGVIPMIWKPSWRKSSSMSASAARWALQKGHHPPR